MKPLELWQNYRVKIIFGALIVTAVLQLFICFFQIAKYEGTLRFGKQIVLLTRSYDPYDPLRGRYVRLMIEEGKFKTDKKICKDRCERTFFVTYKAELNDRGVSEIDDVFLKEPNTELPYLKLDGFYDAYSATIRLQYHFDRFYMQEDQAKAVDRRGGRFLSGDNETKVVVRALNGKGLIENVLVGDQSLSDYLIEADEAEEEN
jgi:uncharacterized membrane-anchored protein